MKLYLTLEGYFQRLPATVEDTIELSDWLESIKGSIGGKQIGTLHRKSGLHFIPPREFTRFLQQSHPTEPITLTPTFYKYLFTHDNIQLPLSPDDGQIPVWLPGETRKEGYYRIIIGDDTTRSEFVNLKRRFSDYWYGLNPLDRLKIALSSLDGLNFSHSPPGYAGVKMLLTPEDLLPEEREAVKYYRSGQSGTVSQATRDLLDKYYPSYELPGNLEIETEVSRHKYIVGRKISRRTIEQIIESAEDFLLVSSYIIEDESLTTLICKKSPTLTRGIWILTDLGDKQIDRLHDENNPYQRTSEKKIRCLNLLLQSGIKIRAGNFHLKTFISEKVAYLGSCNITGGSLDFNLEAGLLATGAIHGELLRYFSYCWQFRTTDDVVPTPKGFLRRGIDSPPSPIFKSPYLLTPRQYLEDLKNELTRSTGKVEIYSRGIDINPELVSLLRYRDTKIFIDTSGYRADNPLPQYSISKLHAKITLLENRVAYIGGINFQFDSDSLSLIDAMCKITDTRQVAHIRQNLAKFIDY